MPASAVGNVRDLIEIVISGTALLGGAMAYVSGAAAAESMIRGDRADELADRINRGLATGFLLGLPLAAIAATVLAII
jgi:hypothetical protein